MYQKESGRSLHKNHLPRRLRAESHSDGDGKPKNLHETNPIEAMGWITMEEIEKIANRAQLELELRKANIPATG